MNASERVQFMYNRQPLQHLIQQIPNKCIHAHVHVHGTLTKLVQ